MSQVNPIKSWLSDRLFRGFINHDIARMADDVTRHSPTPDQAPVVFFNASTRIRGVSLNAAFSLLSAWSLQLQGVPVVPLCLSPGHADVRAGYKQPGRKFTNALPGLHPTIPAHLSRQPGA